MSRARKVKNIIFYAAWSLIWLTRQLEFTCFVALGRLPHYWEAYRYIKYAVAAVCILIIIANFFLEKYTAQPLIVFAALLTIAAGTSYLSEDRYMLWIMLLLIASYKVNSRNIIALSAAVTAAVLIVTIGLCAVGLNTDYIFDEGTRNRHGLGFGWTSLGPGLFFSFMLMYIYLRKERIRWQEIAVMEAINFAFYMLTDTRLTFLLGTAMLLIVFIECIRKKRWSFFRRLNRLWLFLPLIICVLTFAVYLLYNKDNSVWHKLNSILSGRLKLGSAAIDRYGFTLFGQPITWVGYYIVPSTEAYNYVDTAYLQICLNYGILSLISVVGIYMNAIYRAINKRDYYIVLVLEVLALAAFIEQSLFDFSFNVLPVLAFCALDGRPFEFTKDCLRACVSDSRNC